MLNDSFAKAKGLSRTADTQQRQIEDFFRSVASVEILNGSLFKGVTVGATGVDFPLSHKLQRPVQGYILVGSNHPLQLYKGSASSVPDLFFNLRASYSGASSNPIVDLWVF